MLEISKLYHLTFQIPSLEEEEGGGEEGGGEGGG